MVAGEWCEDSFIGRFMLQSIWVNVREHAAEAFDYWGSSLKERGRSGIGRRVFVAVSANFLGGVGMRRRGVGVKVRPEVDR